MKDFPEILAQRLCELVTDTNTLKDYLGVSFSAVSQWKHGVCCPSLQNLCKIATFYGVSTDYLLGISGKEKNSIEEKH